MSSFADRLNSLFEVVIDPRTRKPYTTKEVSDRVQAIGGRVSAPYLSQLRHGHAERPAYDVVGALASFFGVRMEFFYDDNYAEETIEKLREANKYLANPNIVELAQRAAELPEESFQNLIGIVEQMHRDGKSGGTTK